MSDHDAIEGFIPSLESSVVRERHPDYLLVEQINKSGIWFMRRRFEVLLKVKETPTQKIEFEDIGKKSFKFYKGYWEIEPQGQSSRIKYMLEVERPAGIPSFMSRKVLHSNVLKLLKETAAEIERRQAQP